MTTHPPSIIWQKWFDPFGEDIDDARWVDYNNESPPIPQPEKDDDSLPLPKNSKPIKVISSPMGLIPYNEHTASSKIFNFWTGHTNFNITKSIIDIIEHANGVETLDIFTRYRFRIGIGKCFDDAQVMSNINETIYEFLESAA